jgi:diguanylate cyclase (GGDEF)-like protein
MTNNKKKHTPNTKDTTFIQNWGLIQDSLDHLAQGISVFSPDLNLLLFNRNFIKMLGFPPELISVGINISVLFRFNAERGEYGPGDIEEQVNDRLEKAQAFSPHVFERARPDGTVLEIRGNPLDGGGFVTIYTDITERKNNETKLKEMAATDELTGINNRRQFFSLAEHEIHRAIRNNTSISAIMIDADHFKKVNDTYGHVVGDEVLRHIAAACQENLRSVDILGRYGGEEFAVLLPDADRKAATRVGERLRKAISHIAVPVSEGTLSITASLGISTAKGNDINLKTMMERADSALYAAKNAGRNRVMTG